MYQVTKTWKFNAVKKKHNAKSIFVTKVKRKTNHTFTIQKKAMRE